METKRRSPGSQRSREPASLRFLFFDVFIGDGLRVRILAVSRQYEDPVACASPHTLARLCEEFGFGIEIWT